MTISALRNPAQSKWRAVSRAYKAPILLALAGLSIIFGGTLLPLFGHGVLLCLEVLELLFEHFIESVFGVGPRTAQIITAWTGLFAFLILLLEVAKRLVDGVNRLRSGVMTAKARVSKRLHW